MLQPHTCGHRTDRDNLRLVSTQENRHRIGLDLCIIHTAGLKKVENTSTFYLILSYLILSGLGIKLEQKIGIESPCAGSILFRSGPIRCLFS